MAYSVHTLYIINYVAIYVYVYAHLIVVTLARVVCLICTAEA